MSSQLQKKAVQLIAFDQDKNPYITEEALRVLSQMSTNNIHVIAVAGKYRTGKSYILNRVLLDRSHGFNVGHTINACTKGLWMWPELVRLGEKDCLLIDTEGLGSLQEGQSSDLKIFMLALLFSSYLIYNSTGNIDQQALQSLNLVIQLANVLQRQDRYDTQELVNTFPSFLWLLRDFSLQLINDKGEKLSPTQYLEQALKHQPKSTPAAERKNQIRKQLRTFFEHRDCFALVRPTQQEKDLQNLSSLSANRLRPEFVKLIKDLKIHISKEVRPKRVRGRVLSTDGFVQLCKYYTKALVDGKLPTITSHWDNLCISQTHRIFQKYQLQHLKALQSGQIESNNAQKIHRSIVQAGLEAIDKSFLGKLEKQLFKQRFERKLQNQFQEMKIKINHKRNSEMKLLLDSLDCIHNEHTSILDQYEKMMEKMSELSQNSTKDDGVYCQLYLYLSEHSRSLLQESETRIFETKKTMEQKLAFLEDTIASLKKQRQKIQQNHQQQLASLRKQSSANSSFNLQQMKEREQQSLKQIFNLRRQIKGEKDTNKNLRIELNTTNSRCQQIECKCHQLQYQIKALQQKCQEYQIEILKKQELLREDSIKLRKLFREKEIVKNRYEECLDQNVNLRNTIDTLELTIIDLQRKKYPVDKDETAAQLTQARRTIRHNEEEIRNLAKLLSEQKSTYETIINAPYNQSYQTLQRNLQLQTKEKQSLQQKLFEVSRALYNCSDYRCILCKQIISSSLILEHSKACQQLPSELKFDVSYHIGINQAVIYDIQIIAADKRRLLSKTEKQLVDFLINLGHKVSEKETNRQEKLQQSLDYGIQYQERRVTLCQLLHSVDFRSLANPTFIQFLELDVWDDYITEQELKSQVKQALGQMQVQNINELRITSEGQ